MEFGIIMARITDLMKELDYPANEGGVCQGLALMAERARQLGLYSQFKQRMTFLKSLQPGTIKLLIDAAKERRQSKLPSIGDDDILISTEAFFFQVSAFFNPRDIQKFFSEPGPFYSQTNIRKMEELLQQEQPLALPTPFFFNIRSTKQGEPDKEHALLHFLKTIKKSSLSLGMLISSGHHATHLFYDKNLKKWLFTNYDQCKEYSSTKQLINELIDSLSKNGTANLTLKLFTHEPAYKKNKLIHALKTINQKSLQKLYHSTNPNSQDFYGVAPLWIAAQNGHKEVVQNLVKKNKHTNVNIKDNLYGITALHIASSNGQVEIVKLLLTNHAIKVADKDNKNSVTALWIASQNGHAAIVKLLLIKEASRSIINHTDLTHGFTPLRVAAEQGHIGVVNQLLKLPDIDVNLPSANHSSPLWIAAQNGHHEIVQALLRHPKIEVNQEKNDYSPLWIASQNGHYKVVQYLLNHPNIEPNKPNNNGITPLWKAAQKGHTEIVTLFLKKLTAGQVNQTNSSGKSPLSIAIESQHLNVVKLLLQFPGIVASSEDLVKVAILQKKAQTGSALRFFSEDNVTNTFQQPKPKWTP